ncbi:1-phosphofructokinase [Caproiciproducens faecalis]|uniref:Tagatose-6-phosphate kinase n=1 Tax=Caproiciproducens faecalis TaxID=2820301 RepID=A0ABS7DNV6_9FIRM|nr:1-phosphofructokinase [Caproiciproducens faecalis]MBW7572967.1 1-phosphofructokinase [Caproiciproducens faecalis]
MITTVTLNPAMDKTVEIPNFTANLVNRVTAMRADPGGKGINVSKGIASLGGTSRAVAVLGGATGSKIADALKDGNLQPDFLFTNQETRTNTKIIDPVRRTNTDINEPGSPMEEGVQRAVLAKLKNGLKKDDIVVLAGSLPAGAPRTLYRDWILECAAAGAKVFLDADGDLLEHGIEAAPYLIKPNREELSRLFQSSLNSLEEIITAAKTLVRGGIQKTAVSLGADGALLVTSGEVLYAEGLRVPVGSTVGAGDSMVAAFAYGEETGMTARETFRLAMAAGAASVMCSGTQAASRSSIEKLLPMVKVQSLD